MPRVKEVFDLPLRADGISLGDEKIWLPNHEEFTLSADCRFDDTIYDNAEITFEAIQLLVDDMCVDTPDGGYDVVLVEATDHPNYVRLVLRPKDT